MSSDVHLGGPLYVGGVRDAVHIAVVPVRAHRKLSPGERVGVEKSPSGEFVSCDKDHVGIVDPFMVEPIFQTGLFYLCLFPGTVRGMRHHWRHPAFSEHPKGSLEEAKDRLEAFAELAGLHFDDLIQAANAYLDHGEYLCDGGRWESFQMSKTFWDDFQTYTGRIVPEDDRGHFFSCSC